MNLEIKALVGTDYRYIIRPAHFIDAGGGDVTCTVTLPSGATVTPTVTPYNEDSLTVTAVSGDRRTLTLDAGTASIAGLVGEEGGAAVWFDSRLGEIPIRIKERVSATSIILADPLPGAATTGLMQYTTLYTIFTAASGVTAAVGRMIFVIAYTHDPPGGSLSQTETLSGILHVVRHPFSTGLTTDALVNFAPHVRSQLPVQQGSHQRAIDASERVLWRWIRDDLRGRPAGYRTEDALSGSAFHEVHALLTLAHLTRGQELAGGRSATPSADLEERARTLYEHVMRSVPWMDGDGDSIIDESEEDAAAKGPVATVGGLYTSSDFVDADDAAYTPRFRVGSRH